MAAKQDPSAALVALLLRNAIANQHKLVQTGPTIQVMPPVPRPVSIDSIQRRQSSTSTRVSQPPKAMVAASKSDESDNVPQNTIIPIKVFNPERKRDSKTFMLRLQFDQICSLKHLREVLEQL